MDFAATVQSMLLVALGSVGTIVAGRVSDARHRRDRDAELDRAENGRRWEVGRDHALAAIALLREIDTHTHTWDEWRQGFNDAHDRVMAEVELVPNASLRHRAHWTLRSTFESPYNGQFVYQENDGRDYSRMAAINLMEELGAFARGEDVPAESWLSDYVDRVEAWWNGLTFTCTA